MFKSMMPTVTVSSSWARMRLSAMDNPNITCRIRFHRATRGRTLASVTISMELQIREGFAEQIGGRYYAKGGK